MKFDTWRRLTEKFLEFPDGCAGSLPSEAEIIKASRDIGIPFDPDYAEFLRRYGAAMLGPYPIYGLRPVAEVLGDDEWSVVTMTQWYRNQPVPGCENWVVFSSDHAGNPIGMDKNGLIWIHDHDFGGIDRLVDNFEAYIRKRCFHLE